LGKKTNNRKKKLLKLCLVPAVPTLLGIAALCVPPIQNYILKKAVGYAGRKAGLDIKAERIKLGLPFDLQAYGLTASAPGADSLIGAHSLRLNIRPMALLRNTAAVEGLEITRLRVNTGGYIPYIYIKGTVDTLLAGGAVDLKAETICVGEALVSGVDASVVVYPSEDAGEPDPASWSIRLGRLLLNRIAAGLQMPADSFGLNAYIPQAEIIETSLELKESRYGAASLAVNGADIAIALSGGLPASAAFDPRHIELTRLSATLDSAGYNAGAMRMRLQSLSVAERSGLEVVSLNGWAEVDSAGTATADLQLRTAHSQLSLAAKVPGDAFGAEPSGRMEAKVSLLAGKADIPLFFLPFEGFNEQYPNRPLLIEAEAGGNSKAMDIKRLSAKMPNTFRFQASGSLARPLDSLRRNGRLKFGSFINGSGLEINGNINYSNQTASAELFFAQAARARLNAKLGVADGSYFATLSVDSLVPSGFMSFDSAAFISATLSAEGRGFDLFADSTRSTFSGQLHELRYGKAKIGRARLKASLDEGKAEFRLISDEEAAKMDFEFSASLSRNKLSGMITGNVDSLDLYALRFVDDPFATSFQVFAEIESDMNKRHNVDITLGNWLLTTVGRPFRAKTLTLRAYSDADTTRLSFNTGDLGAILTSNTGIETLSRRISLLSDNIGSQLRRDSIIHIAELRPLFPEMLLDIRAGKDNPLHAALRRNEIEFDGFRLDASSSPLDGLRAGARLLALHRDTFRIDTIRAEIIPDQEGFTYKAAVVKNRYMRQPPFVATVEGSLRNEYADAVMRYRNYLSETGLLLGVKASKASEGFRLNFFPDTAVIAFNSFAVNPGNSVNFTGIKNINANLRFTGADNRMLWLHSTPADDSTLTVVRAELSHIPLGVITRGFASLPSLGGSASMDLQYAPSQESFTVAGEIHVDNLTYEGEPVGELMLNGVYMPLADNAHEVDMHFYRNSSEVSSTTLVYDMSRNRLNGVLHFDALPLAMFSPFAPQTSFTGALNGQVDIAGSADAPKAAGFLQLDTAAVFSAAVSSRFGLDNRRVELRENILKLDKFKVFASGNNPFEINGSVSFSDLAKPSADLSLGGNNLQILDARRTAESIAYGKLFANVSTTIKGPLSSLAVRGDIRLLGGTNLTYIMQESPLTVEDRLKDLVTFTSFTDTSTIRRRRAQTPPLPLGGLDMLMLVHIDPVVQLSADINNDKSSYVNLEGGGDLSFQYNRQGQMLVNGRYTLSGGKLKYALPIIPLKEFSVKPNSYIQWDGDPFNPLLGLAATQLMRATVSLAGESPRPVEFEVGVDVRNRLDNMSLLFTIDAPDDASVQSELERMGPEGRSTQAVGMMVTGLYLANGSTGKVNMDMGDALNSFLQSEINHIAGSALRTVDISFGMDSYEQTPEKGGGQRTDYSFRFAKRFYNDRLRIMLGGKLSSGDVQQKEAFIDNASIEWRMNRAGTGYLKLFHDRNYQSLLDGEVIETGAGIVFRRRMLNLFDLFK
jgi:hypothetical protein